MRASGNTNQFGEVGIKMRVRRYLDVLVRKPDVEFFVENGKFEVIASIISLPLVTSSSGFKLAKFMLRRASWVATLSVACCNCDFF